MVEYEKFIDDLADFDCISFFKYGEDEFGDIDWKVYTLDLNEKELNETVTNALGTLYTMIFFDDDDFEPEFNAYLTDPKTYVKELMGMQQNAIIMKKCSASEKFIESLKTKVILELPDADEDLI